jgi:choline dehydrogenase-like flavoprotein
LASVPFFFDRREAIMQRYAYMLNFGTLIGSEPNGVVQLKPNLADGRPFTWSLGERDRENIKYALTTLVKLGHYAGAKRCVMPSKPGIEFVMTDANVERFIKNFTAYPLRMEDLMMGTAHPQGGNRMAGDDSSHQSTRVLNGNFQVEGYDNVYVADASLFPSSIGLNPQWTIMAMSSLASKKILAQHG